MPGLPEFAAFMAGMESHFDGWRTATAVTLKALQPGFHPKALIASLGESLLAHYADKPLIGSYDVYQHLMDYWAAAMQDDCYLVAADGWRAQTARIIERDKRGNERDKGWTCDLVPKALIVARYFAGEQAAIDRLAADLESVAAELAELEEEEGGEEGIFAELEKVNRANVSARLREARAIYHTNDEAGAEADVLDKWLALSNREAELKKQLWDAEADLDAKAYARYPKLTGAEIKTLVVDDKWLAALAAAIHGEMDRISQALTQRVRELAERYETPMPQQVNRVAELEARVNAHLAKMGFAR